MYFRHFHTLHRNGLRPRTCIHLKHTHSQTKEKILLQQSAVGARQFAISFQVVYLRQLVSSDRSWQSGRPSHCRTAGIQWPESHWKEPGRHVCNSGREPAQYHVCVLFMTENISKKWACVQRLLTTVPLIWVVPAVVVMVTHPVSRDALCVVTSIFTFRARPWFYRPQLPEQRDTHIFRMKSEWVLTVHTHPTQAQNTQKGSF